MPDPLPTLRPYQDAPGAASPGEGTWLPRHRRAPYPASQAIGAEGARACQEIIAAARRLFVERGYHGTSVQAVAEATGRSDAAFYQYFHGKLEVFRIFFEELGVDLVDHFQRLPVLSEGPAGLAVFRAWLGELGAVLRRHSPVFAEWPLSTAEPAVVDNSALDSAALDSAAVDSAVVDNPSEEYLQVLAASLPPRLARADTGGVDTRVLSVAVICIVEWTHIVSDARGKIARGPDEDDALHDALASMIHRALFPAPELTPHSPEPTPRLAEPTPRLPGPTVRSPGSSLASPRPRPRPDLAALARAAGIAGTTGTARTAAPAPGEVPAQRDASLPPGLRRSVTGRGRSTVETIIEAAVAAFEHRGLAGTSVNDIIARSGVAHGTFYRYWTDRTAIFTTLAHRAAVHICDHFDALPAVGTADELAGWVDDWLRIVERHGTVFHIWTCEILDNPPLWPLARAVRLHLEDVAARLPPPRPTATTPATMTIVLWTVLTEFPYNAWLRHPVLTREQVLHCLTLLMARGVLGLRTATATDGRTGSTCTG
ncbi:TetR family transcriptional regulator [Frankia sp. AiPs1]|uniref:TetR family transcriptional regulator n=1 Tax=Frankia sp. AiPs1 TaxID=573493 RepID=UPI0020432A70|nr:TetR family transcriptional regulator [Frankia sp. AiPs1]MCM3923108.1 TetR family transcriptional regulator [Frankia sp. AiPs1]